MQGYGLDMLMRMAYQRQREPQEAVNRLAESLGNVMAQRGQGAFRQDAVNWFADGEVTADKIQKFQSMYPNVDPQEVLKIAGAAASQKKAQRMKDVGAQLIQSIRDNGGEINQDIIGKVLQNANPSDVPEIMQLIKGSGDVWKSLKQEYQLSPGETVVRPNRKSIGGQDVIAKGAEKTPERPYKIGEIITYKDAGGRDMQGTVAGYSADGKVQWTDVKDVTKPEKEPDKTPTTPSKKEESLSNGMIQDWIWDATKKDYVKSGVPYSRYKPESDSAQIQRDRQFSVTLRKEFNALPEVKEYNQTVPKIQSMKAALEESKRTKNFVAVDQALITLFNKITDPNSVVRESEYARTAMNMPLFNAIKGKVSKVLSGGAGLTPEERQAIVAMATLMEKGYQDIYNRRHKEYQGYGVAGGLDSNFLENSVSSQKSTGKKPLSAY